MRLPLVTVFADETGEMEIPWGELEAGFFECLAAGAGVGGFAFVCMQFPAAWTPKTAIGFLGALEQEDFVRLVETVEQGGDFVRQLHRASEAGERNSCKNRNGERGKCQPQLFAPAAAGLRHSRAPSHQDLSEGCWPAALTWFGWAGNLGGRMLEAIEKLLILQDRDRKIRRVQAELAHIDPERQTLRVKQAAAQAELEKGRNRVKQIESDRKRLELDVEAKKSQIEKYANQQLQTRKNEEYRALAHEIETCKADIMRIEDQEIVLMEQAEIAQKEVVRLTREADEAKKLADGQVTQLGEREKNLQTELASLQSNREELSSAVDESVRARYERLVKNKGENVLVGVNHGVCGGCHMKLPAQVLVACQAHQELVTCTNCGRILYHTRDMELAAAE